MALIQRREIEKPEFNRFLDLVGDIAGQNHPRDMCLDQVDITDGVAIGGGVLQCADQGLLVIWHTITPVYLISTPVVGMVTTPFR